MPLGHVAVVVLECRIVDGFVNLSRSLDLKRTKLSKWIMYVCLFILVISCLVFLLSCRGRTDPNPSMHACDVLVSNTPSSDRITLRYQKGYFLPQTVGHVVN